MSACHAIAIANRILDAAMHDFSRTRSNVRKVNALIIASAPVRDVSPGKQNIQFTYCGIRLCMHLENYLPRWRRTG